MRLSISTVGPSRISLIGLIFLGGLFFNCLGFSEDKSEIPHAWPAQRYEQLIKQCPFALATPIAPVEEMKPAFAANWFVSGIGQLGGESFVTIKARDLSTEFSLYGHDANPENGVSLSSIDWSDTVGNTKVVIKKGSETARLEFNEAEISGPGKSTTPPQGTPAPNAVAAQQKGVPNGAGIKIKPVVATPVRSMAGLPVGPLPPRSGVQPWPAAQPSAIRQGQGFPQGGPSPQK